MNARHTPSLESLLERHREGGAFPTYAELSALAAPAAPSEQAEPRLDRLPLDAFLRTDGVEGFHPDYGRGVFFTENASRLLYAAAPAAPLPGHPEQSATSIKYDHGFQSLAEQFAYQVECNPRTFTADLPSWQALCFYLDSLRSAASPSPAPAPTEMESKLRDAVTILRGALVHAECAIKGREHTGFITKALCATEFPPLSRMGGITSKESAETAAPEASAGDGQ